MLAPRILHFARNQIFWDCPSLSACETFPAGLPRAMDTAAGPDRHWRGRLQGPEEADDLAGSNDQPLSAFWQTAVRKYTSCNITNRSDKLIAIWGIAKLVKDAMGVEYGEGLWEENLEDQLAWRVAECRLHSRPITPANRTIPSWSWASMDGEIVVPERLSDQPHLTVKDHNRQRLTLDLVGVKRFARPVPSVFGGPSSLKHNRGMSDSVLQVKNTSNALSAHEVNIKDKSNETRSSSPERVDSNAEPRFHSKSIPIQGHVDCGTLVFNREKQSWLLHLQYDNKVSMEAYPDVIPGSKDARHHSHFVVLSAKQVVQPKSQILDSIIDEDDEDENDDDVEIDGYGILLEPAEEHHFRRTGAFRFRVANLREFESLQRTDDWEEIPTNLYDAERGRKFWLD